ncbi:Maltose phosphorylase / Trehalose phosphorylase [hydrothermal vent metagenome]|uniref:Maltose phosphorylase / Trehalose phosphorylase n=1 Tax=hydrothermal vent metagenome TaxID=652676 RepID=A0A3B0VUT1_9ZZZZ
MSDQAVIFDLDGVLTDTSEYHYHAWHRLADEENLPFNRQINEQLRGVSRQRSLEFILNGQTVDPAKLSEMMNRKNDYYVESLQNIAQQNLLPGMLAILQTLKARGTKLAVGSASKNAQFVLQRLGILPYFDVVADGHSVSQSKPAPDLFLFAAQQLGVSPDHCTVVEDATAGIEAALAAGMWAVGIGPQERVGRAHVHFADTQALCDADLETIIHKLGNSEQGWLVTENEYTPAKLNHKETIFTIGNGYLCSRGAYPERHENENRTTFIHGVFDDMPVSFTELANVPDWTNLELFVAGERFSLAEPEGEILAYRRQLNLKTGLLQRQLTWRSPQGRMIRLEDERWCSLANQHLVGLRCAITPLNFSGQIELHTGLMGHTDNQGLRHMDILDQGNAAGLIWLHSQTRHTHIEIGQAMQVTAQGSELGTLWQTVWDSWGQPTLFISAAATVGQAITITKLVSTVTSQDSEDVGQRAIELLRGADYGRIQTNSIAEWAKTWANSDVIIEGDPKAQLAMRFNLFQLLIAVPRQNERVSIGAKALSGYGYRGHAFWDTEVFILPFFTFTQPRLARNLLMYRYHNLPGAREKAAMNGFEGAQFPWESAADGTEVTPRWVPSFEDPTELIRIWPGDIEIHITADIAYATWLYWQATADDAWMRDYGVALILEGAVFWGSRVEQEADGYYHLRDVIGPDEYHDHVDDNAYTNQMVAWHLQTALDMLAWLRAHAPTRHAQLVESLDLTAVRLQLWNSVSQRMFINQNTDGLIEQFSGYFDLIDADIAVLRDPARTQSMHTILGIEGANQAQVLKQPDVLMLLYLLRNQYSPEEIKVNWDYYHPRTDHEHGSSLGPAITAILACLMADPEEGYAHFMRAATVDLENSRLNADDGIHAASAGALWLATVFGFAGLRLEPEKYAFSPQLPSHWTRLAFSLELRGEKMWVEIRPGQSVTVKNQGKEA